MDQEDINDSKADIVEIRRRVGMVFQASPFPKSIFSNISYGLETSRIKDHLRKKERNCGTIFAESSLVGRVKTG